jgi:hypothetical protein
MTEKYFFISLLDDQLGTKNSDCGDEMTMRVVVVALAVVLCGAGAVGQAIQEFRPLDVTVGARGQDESYPISGCQILWKENERYQEFVAVNPEHSLLQKSTGAAAWNFQVGDRKDWWATNLTTSSPQYNTEYTVPSTCRGVGVNCYVFVEDDAWSRGRVNQQVIDSLVAAFDHRTPAYADKGIYEVATDVFGPAPNIDNDPKIIILILDIRDGWAGSGGFVAGYFAPWNQGPDPTSGHRSNVAEFLYIDCDPLDLRTASGLGYAGRVAAHEFQHLLHSQYTPELTFVNEGCSMYAEVACGYAIEFQSLYAANPDVYLLGWNSTLADYGRSGYWTLYLANQFSDAYIKLMTMNTASGVNGINNALTQLNPPTARRFADIFEDWVMANQILDRTVDPKYGYTYTKPLERASATEYPSPNTGSQSASLNRLAADYIRFRAGSDLSITFSSSAATLKIKALKKRSAGGLEIEDVPRNTEYTEFGFGSDYPEITFVVMNTSQTTSETYTYQGSGSGGAALELKWDETEPVGYFRLTPLDTVAVVFNAVPGARLDSIRVALRRSGSAMGGVWRLGQSTAISPIGAPLAVPITATTTLTPPVLNPGSTYPYQVPYPNWRTVDLRPRNIILDSPFVVGFWLPQDTSTFAYVMATTRQGNTSYNSFTYLNTPSSGEPGWYYIGDGNQIWLWLIRAYASYGGSSFFAPTLVSPSDGATSVPTTVTLNWSAVGSATHYRVQLSTAATFATLVVHDSTLTTTSRQVGPLQEATTYYWRVSARNAREETEFSQARSFTTAGIITSAPMPATPPNGSVDLSSPISFSWAPVETATSYHFQLSNDPSFGVLLVSDSMLTVTTRQVQSLRGNSLYYWRVRAKNALSVGPFSQTWHFTTSLSYMLAQNYPNPFNPSTTIRYALPRGGIVSLRVFDHLGREVKSLVRGPHQAGLYEVRWDGTDASGSRVASGLYFYRLESGPFIESRRMLLIK